MNYLMLLLSLPCFSTFLLICYPCILLHLMFLYSCLHHFFSSRYMLEPKFAIYHRAASLSSITGFLGMYAILTEESLTMLFSNTETPMDGEDSPCLIHAHQSYF